jgi:hypothetical protein
MLINPKTMLLKEVAFTDHYKERVKDRIKNAVIEYPFEFPKLTAQGLSAEVIQEVVTREIKTKLIERAHLEGINFENTYVCLLLAEVLIKYNNQIYKPAIISDESKGGREIIRTGNSYIVALNGNTARTIIISKTTDESSLKAQVLSHLKLQIDPNISLSEIDFFKFTPISLEISVNNVIKDLLNAKKEKVDKNAVEQVNMRSLPYVVRGDYRLHSKGQKVNFTLKVGGKDWSFPIVKVQEKDQRIKWDVTVKTDSKDTANYLHNKLNNKVESYPGKMMKTKAEGELLTIYDVYSSLGFNDKGDFKGISAQLEQVRRYISLLEKLSNRTVILKKYENSPGK